MVSVFADFLVPCSLMRPAAKKEHKGNCPHVPCGVGSTNVSRTGNFLGYAYIKHTHVVWRKTHPTTRKHTLGVVKNTA